MGAESELDGFEVGAHLLVDGCGKEHGIGSERRVDGRGATEARQRRDR